ncbi:hypothetical protein BOX15_Mlig002743g3 [Macrostomum lignano]|uniref:Uncharacterized protein n=2 Tax=Macrostomum lignano TaxID=282301 RepID=A0A267GZL7_9PLAT|nr:hypothetical protein BOX15_Mlig002743g3 [Macrostomum lignano]
MSVFSSEQDLQQQQKSVGQKRTFNLSKQPPTLLKDYCNWHGGSLLPAAESGRLNGWHRSTHKPHPVPHRESDGDFFKGQTSLSLTPNALLTARYYATHKNKQPAGAASAGQPDDQAMPPAESSGFCKRYPFSQVIYSNVLTQPDNSTSTGINKAGKSTYRQPSFVLKRRVARERSSVSGPLDRAMSSDNSSEQVVRKAITQLRDAMHLPPK